MNFIMNGRTYDIIVVDEQIILDIKEAEHEKGTNYFGLFSAINQTIYLNNKLESEQMIYTLLHELLHCYIWCYTSQTEAFSEEDMAYILSNSFFEIQDIIDNVYDTIYERNF